MQRRDFLKTGRALAGGLIVPSFLGNRLNAAAPITDKIARYGITTKGRLKGVEENSPNSVVIQRHHDLQEWRWCAPWDGHNVGTWSSAYMMRKLLNGEELFGDYQMLCDNAFSYTMSREGVAFIHPEDVQPLVLTSDNFRSPLEFKREPLQVVKMWGLVHIFEYSDFSKVRLERRRNCVYHPTDATKFYDVYALIEDRVRQYPGKPPWDGYDRLAAEFEVSPRTVWEAMNLAA